MKTDIVIIGAGAAGLICAYRIAKNTKQSVLVIEKESYPGKKLKAAGSGKCNITNKDYRQDWYHSKEKAVLDDFLKEHSYKEILDLFDELGIAYYEQNGYYYPLSNQGKQVVELINKRCLDEGVEFMPDSLVTKVDSNDKGYTVTYENDRGTNQVACQRVVFATGGKASKKLGGSETGYQMMDVMGISMTDIFPALCPIYINDPLLKIAKGVRVKGIVSIKKIDGEFLRDEGQIQFNEDCISGICVMNLSSFFYPWMKENKMGGLFLDLLPGYQWSQVKEFLLKHQSLFGEETLLNCLDALLPRGLSLYILARCKYDKQTKMAELEEKGIHKIASMLKKLELNYCNQADYEKAQVTNGGVNLCEVSMQTFESQRYKGLYLLGELLDVNGNCGGYNITFAMLSAMVAAADIIKNEEYI